MLLPGAYANVTGGQRVEALGGSDTTFHSGLLQTSTALNTTKFTGGLIRVIDQFFTLPQNMSATSVALNLTSSVGAMAISNLSEFVDITPDLTYFVPNNDAFQRIGGDLANLSTQELTNILEYHVVNGSAIYSTDISNGAKLTAVNGKHHDV